MHVYDKQPNSCPSGVFVPAGLVIRYFGLQLLEISLISITKTCLYNFDPLKPHFYTVKLGFTWVYNIFLISAQNMDCGYSLEPPRRGGSNEYPQSMFWAEIKKISEFFIWIFSVFWGVKFSIYLNRRVFVMLCKTVWIYAEKVIITENRITESIPKAPDKDPITWTDNTKQISVKTEQANEEIMKEWLGTATKYHIGTINIQKAVSSKNVPSSMPKHADLDYSVPTGPLLSIHTLSSIQSFC